MRTFILLLLPCFGFSQTQELKDSTFYSVDILENTKIRFQADSGELTFVKGYLLLSTDDTLEMIEVPSQVFTIVEKSLFNIFEDKMQRINSLAEKILFYEKYCGTLEKKENCFIFTPVTNPPQLEKCNK